jgi:hypothetical protein
MRGTCSASDDEFPVHVTPAEHVATSTTIIASFTIETP